MSVSSNPFSVFRALRLDGRTALVTGSSQGIGRAIALAFAEAGARVILNSRSEDSNACEALAAARALGVESHFIPSDLAQPGAGRQLGEAAIVKSGQIDIVVSNVAVQLRTPWHDVPPAEFELQMRTNFQAAFELIQATVPAMQKRGWGRVLTIGSVQQLRANSLMPVYAASKGAQTTFVKYLAKQVGGEGVTVNNLAPGVVLTKRNREPLADAAYARKFLSCIPAGYFAEASDVTGLALVLCSEAGRYITGQDIFVDGGLSLP
jgi:NAD(P)-dependent dehydrogenase (short-subunit alcohol dehydrogenase family)